MTPKQSNKRHKVKGQGHDANAVESFMECPLSKFEHASIAVNIGARLFNDFYLDLLPCESNVGQESTMIPKIHMDTNSHIIYPFHLLYKSNLFDNM